MKRSAAGLAEVADLHNLASAFHAAARGKRGRGDVEAFRANLDRELAVLRAGLLAETLKPGPMRRFRIHDPTPRLSQAPGFRDRVLHHAIMNHVGPVLDRALVFDTYACRAGKGTLAAVQRASTHALRYQWHAQIDVRGYFANIDHAILLDQLGRKFKDAGLMRLLARIVAARLPRSISPIFTSPEPIGCCSKSAGSKALCGTWMISSGGPTIAGRFAQRWTRFRAIWRRHWACR